MLIIRKLSFLNKPDSMLCWCQLLAWLIKAIM